jgi:hypothetical protein
MFAHLPQGIASLDPKLISLIPSGSDYFHINILMGSEVCKGFVFSHVSIK